jgi:hypothetical protein
MYKKWFIIVCIIIIPVMIAGYSRGDDLDDGISTATDEGVSADDEIGKKDNNVNFIVIESMAAAKMKAKKGDQAANGAAAAQGPANARTGRRSGATWSTSTSASAGVYQ